MADVTTNFPPQTYSSSFFLNSLQEDDKVVKIKKKRRSRSRPSTSEDASTLLDCFSTRMGGIYFLLLLISLEVQNSYCSSEIVSYETNHDVESCNEEMNPKEREFSSLLEFHKNTNSFKLGTKNFRGNYVRFNFTLPELEEDQFDTKDAQFIIKLKLDGKKISEIADGAFHFLDCLKYLDLQQNQISQITRRTFYPLKNLVKLNLSYNLLESLEEGYLIELGQLKWLDVSHNRIKSLDLYTFSNLNNLAFLDLSYNELSDLETGTFNVTPALDTLLLSNNKIRNVHLFDWMNLPLLTLIDFGHNLFEDFSLPSSNLPNLTDLYVEDNHIKTFHFLYFTIKRIKINYNSFYCNDLSLILDYFKENKVAILDATEKKKSNINGIFCIETEEQTEIPTKIAAEDIPDLKSKYPDLDQKLNEWNIKLNALYILVLTTACTIGGFFIVDIALNYKELIEAIKFYFVKIDNPRAIRPPSVSPPNFSSDLASGPSSPQEEIRAEVHRDPEPAEEIVEQETNNEELSKNEPSTSAAP